MGIYKIAVAGCGGMSRTWIRYALARKDAEIVALIDVNLENAQKMADEFKLNVPVFVDLKQAIEQTGANLVFDVTIPDSHAAIVSTALKMGCSVMGEKPMAASMKEAGMVLQTAEQSGKTYAVMQNRRYNRQIRALKHMIASDTIGEVGMIAADFFLGAHFGGFRDLMDSPLILDMAIHTFDQARYITGSDPVSVYCHEYNPAGSWYKGNAAAICIFEFANGAAFSYRGSWCAEGAPTSWESDWRISGSRGTAIWNGQDEPYCEIVVPSEENKFLNTFERVEDALEWNGQEGHAGCLDEMFAALAEGRKAETDCADNVKSLLMVEGALESAKTGRKITLKDLM